MQRQPWSRTQFNMKVPFGICLLTSFGFCNFVHKTRDIVSFVEQIYHFWENVILLLLQWSCFCIVGKLFRLYRTYSTLFVAVTFRKVLHTYTLVLYRRMISQQAFVCWKVRNVPSMFMYVYVFGMCIHPVFLPFIAFYATFEVTICKK